MTATATSPQTDAKLTTSIDRAAWVGAVCDGLRAGRLAPYFGPGVAHLAGSSAPTTPAELAAFFAAKAKRRGFSGGAPISQHCWLRAGGQFIYSFLALASAGGWVERASAYL